MKHSEPTRSRKRAASNEAYRQACEKQVREYLAFHYGDETDYDIEIIGNIARVSEKADTATKSASEEP